MRLFFLSVLLSVAISYSTERLSLGVAINKILVYTLSQLFLGFLAFKSMPFMIIVFFSFLILVAAVDFYTKTIVTATLGILFIMASIQAFFLTKLTLISHISGGLWGFFVYGSIYLVAKLIYKREAFGSGDVWLMGIIGLFLGFSKSLWISFLSFYVALLVIGVIFLVYKKDFKDKEIPFGPSMVVATMVVTLWEEQLMAIYQWLFL